MRTRPPHHAGQPRTDRPRAHRRRAILPTAGRAAATMLALAAVVATSGPADADATLHRSGHSTDIYCDTWSDGVTVAAGVSRSEEDGGPVETYAFAAVVGDDETLDWYGEATGIRFADGRIEATLELRDHDDQVQATATLEGTYVIGRAQTFRGRPLRLLGNQHLVRTTTVAPVTVAWTTFDVAGLTAEPPVCDTYDLGRDDILTQPRRLSFPAEEYLLRGPCAADPVSEVLVVPSEGGLSMILLGPDGYVGETNVDPNAPGPQLLRWWPGDGVGDPIDRTLTLSLSSAGTPSTTVVTDKGVTIRTTTRPLDLAFTAGLPGTGTVSTTCGLDRVDRRIVVEE